MIDETGSKVVKEMIGRLNLSKQECSGVRRDSATIEICYHFSWSKIALE
jgi:hypothetical protein